MQMNEVINFQKKIEKFDPLLTPKLGQIATSFVRSDLCIFALGFQRMKNIGDWTPHEGEILV